MPVSIASSSFHLVPIQKFEPLDFWIEMFRGGGGGGGGSHALHRSTAVSDRGFKINISRLDTKDMMMVEAKERILI